MPNKNKEINVEREGVDPYQAKEMEMHIGSRWSSPCCEAMEDIYRGSIQDIEGCIFPVLATEDTRGYPF